MKVHSGLVARLAVSCLLAVFSIPTLAAPARPPKTALDYYLLWACRDAEGDKQKAAQELLTSLKESGGYLHDTQNGYLKANDGCCCTGPTIVCLFRRTDGSYLAAIKYGDEEGEPPVLGFYEYRNGQIVKTKTSPLPVKYNRQFDYEMPRFGTTIKVRDSEGRMRYALQWNRERFVLRPAHSTRQK
jgi:hypothetical protein